jgi:hypothetical protein
MFFNSHHLAASGYTQMAPLPSHPTDRTRNQPSIHRHAYIMPFELRADNLHMHHGNDIMPFTVVQDTHFVSAASDRSVLSAWGYSFSPSVSHNVHGINEYHGNRPVDMYFFLPLHYTAMPLPRYV